MTTRPATQDDLLACGCPKQHVTDCGHQEGCTVPTDAPGLAELMRFEDAGPEDDGAEDLYTRLVNQEGQERTTKLWAAAVDHIEYEERQDTAVKQLHQCLNHASVALNDAMDALDALVDGDAWHTEYADGPTGEDMIHLLYGVARDLRIAKRLNPVTPDDLPKRGE